MPNKTSAEVTTDEFDRLADFVYDRSGGRLTVLWWRDDRMNFVPTWTGEDGVVRASLFKEPDRLECEILLDEAEMEGLIPVRPPLMSLRAAVVGNRLAPGGFRRYTFRLPGWKYRPERPDCSAPGHDSGA